MCAKQKKKSDGTNAQERRKLEREQHKRLVYLVDTLAHEASADGEVPKLPTADEELWQVFRSLVNIRPPRLLDEEVLRVQDEYLSTIAQLKGHVCLASIPHVEKQFEYTRPGGARMHLWAGDITRLDVDAIVNAANTQMLGCFVPLHECIDNTIHTFAGVQMRADCARQMNVRARAQGGDFEMPVGEPLLTEGYNLPARHVIHVAGPIVEDQLTIVHERQLARAYENVLDLCAHEGFQSVAFPCISTGAFSFSHERAAEIAVDTVRTWLEAHPETTLDVVFDVYEEIDAQAYSRVFTFGSATTAPRF